MNAALERTILDRLRRLDEARLGEVLDFVDCLTRRSAREGSCEPSEASVGGASDDVAEFFGFAPFPHRGGCVSEELVNRLREEQDV
ncbi:MAG: hypothetical protein HY900_00730 [Deltaproteobacteria bacterium]|nr:hypothetical protein [Deltaproteobacteria bacterium]